jgi:hypothetical protein
LQRGYLTPDEGNLASNFRFIRAVFNHPVKCVNVFLECHKRVVFELSNARKRVPSSGENEPLQTVENQRNKDAK